MKLIADSLLAANETLIVAHVSPDGDTLGSAVALYLALKKVGKHSTVAVDGKIPDKLRLLKRYCFFRRENDLVGEKFDCAVAVDVADVSRMGSIKDAFFSADVTLNVDHHPTNTKYAERNYVECLSSTGEIILKLIGELGASVDENIANALYIAISTDTGNFIYSSVTEETLKAAAYLRKCGADIPRLCGMIYAERSLGATKLIGRGIDAIELFCDGKVAATKLYKKDIDECGAAKEDTECMINYAREIKGVEIAIFVNEQSGTKAKVGLRSNEYADVAALASKFGGGGHVHAAGYTDYGTMDEIYKRAVESAVALIK